MGATASDPVTNHITDLGAKFNNIAQDYLGKSSQLGKFLDYLDQKK